MSNKRESSASCVDLFCNQPCLDRLGKQPHEVVGVDAALCPAKARGRNGHALSD